MLPVHIGRCNNYSTPTMISRMLSLAVFLTAATVTAHVASHEMYALFQLYEKTNGESWEWKNVDDSGSTWNFTQNIDGEFVDDPCISGWQGISCSNSPQLCSVQTCHVITLSLSKYNLMGPIPTEMSSLTELRALSLAFNTLTGTIPTEIGFLVNLEALFLNNNDLDGHIPPELGNLVMMVILALGHNYALAGPLPLELGNLVMVQQIYLDKNAHTGTLPSAIGTLTALEVLDLDSNYLTGHIPPEVGNLAALEFLGFDYNYLSGRIPPEVGSLLMLSRLHLTSNSLSGLIPLHLGNLTRLERLYINNNLLTGRIPSSLGGLIEVVRLDLSYNALTGSIPLEICNLVTVKLLGLNNMALTGHIPSEISFLVMLESLDLDYNELTGPIPAELGNLTQLMYLYLSSNSLTGHIPPETGRLEVMEWIEMRGNTLTGPVPSELSSLVHLDRLDLGDNFLTGSIPPELCNLVAMDWLDLRNNFLDGPIPPTLGSLLELDYLNFSCNALTGNIPSEVDSFAALERMDLHSNLLTGHIPPEIGTLDSLELLDLSSNSLTGSVPAELGQIETLQYIFVRSNFLTGNIGGIFNSSTQRLLEAVDMSDNLLSGHSMASLYSLSALKVVALSVNCFQEELPDAMCNAATIEVLSLNGLGAAEGCANTVKFPLSGVSMFNAIGGTLPECVWHLPNLTTLHLTGNGLTGSIISQLPDYSTMEDLSLSHNQFSGTLPFDIQKVGRVDVSHNKFSGKYEDAVEVWRNSVIDLEINRLSGQLSISKLESTLEVKVLRGNMFSCDSIPANDEYARDYICGSEDLNESLYVLGSALGVTCFIVFAAYASAFSVRQPLVSNPSLAVNALLNHIHECMTCVDVLSLSKVALRPIAVLCKKFEMAARLSVWLLLVVLTVGAPIYIVRGLDESDVHSTHSNTYSWFWTIAYLHGVLPAGLIMLSWFVTLCFCVYYIFVVPMIVVGPDNNRECALEQKQTSCISKNYTANNDSNSSTVKGGTLKAYGWVGAALLFNGVVTIAVNTMYIYVTQQPLSAAVVFGVQLSLASFKLVYSLCAFPILSGSITDPIANIIFRLQLLIVNNLVIPGFVTAFASPSCFQGLLVAADAVSTPYTYERCSMSIVGSDGTFCFETAPVEVESAPVIPPFVYNNQCASVLLTSYIPVLILGFSIQLMLTFLAPVIIFQVGKWINLQNIAHGLLWPEFWLDSNISELSRRANNGTSSPDFFLKLKNIFCFDILNSLVVMLTFGLSSPLLAVVVSCSVASKMRVLELLVGRFTAVLSKGDRREEVHFALRALTTVTFPLDEVLLRSFWIIAWTSALFFTVVCWDMVGDHVEWLEGIWVPIVTMCTPLILWAMVWCVKRNRGGDDVCPVEVELASEHVPESSPRDMASNPLHFAEIESSA